MMFKNYSKLFLALENYETSGMMTKYLNLRTEAAEECAASKVKFRLAMLPLAPLLDRSGGC